MSFRNRMQNPKTVVFFGMLCLALALVWTRFPFLTGQSGLGLADALRGFLFGLSIGLNLWSVRLSSRRRQSACRAA